MFRKLIIGIAVTLIVVMVFSLPAYALTDTFQSYTNGQLLTDDTMYDFQDFPLASFSAENNTSSLWTMGNGSLRAVQDSTGNKWGKVIDGDEGIYRLETQETAVDTDVSFRYKAANAQNATSFWMRHITQFWLYEVQFDRSDGCLIVKRKVPTNNNGEWGGPGTLIANKGVYYSLLFDSDTPAHSSTCSIVGTGVSYSQLSTTTMAHDATDSGGTSYNFRVTITTLAPGVGTCTGVTFNCVKIQLFRGGALVMSWTDKNDGKAANGATFQSHWDAGYYEGVTGYTEAWGKPIYSAGISGFRNDAAQTIYFDDFVMTDEAGEGDTTAPTPNPATFSTAPTNDAANQIAMVGTTAADDSTPIEYLFTHTACASNGGTGGTSSSWQESTSYTDTGLQVNKCYGYSVQSRDAVPNTGTASAVVEEYSSAATPGAPTISSVTPTTFALANAANGNPSSNPTTNFAVQVVNTSDGTWNNMYVDAVGSPSASAVWLSDAVLDNLIVTGLDPSTSYDVKVKARNHESDETAFSTATSQTTLALPTSSGAPGGNLRKGTIRVQSGTFIIR